MLINIELQQLQCNGQSDGGDGAKPYLWTDLLEIDESTGSVSVIDHPVAAIASRVVIQSGMKEGDSAVIPDSLAHLNARLPNAAPPPGRDLLLVAVLLDQHDTSGAAISDGFNAFLSDLPDEVTKQLLQLAGPASRGDAIKQIQNDVDQKVEQAIKGDLSTLDKIEIGLGLETPDRTIGSDYALFHQEDGSPPLVTTSFTLHFRSSSGDDFALNAQLLVTVDPCEDELLQVESLQTALSNAEGAGKQLANAHGGEPTAAQQQEMQQIEQEILQLRAKLKTAEEALQKCRERVVPTGNKPVVSATLAPTKRA